MQILEYDTWKDDLLTEIEASVSTTEKGDRFVQRILRDRYQLSEDDAINATDCAGAGDKGIDAVHIDPAEDGTPPNAVVIQGKYGAAAQGLSPYQEFQKFASGLQAAYAGQAPTDALQQCASVIKSGGVVQYLVATVDPLPSNDQQEIDDIRELAHQRFAHHVVVDAVSLVDVYNDIVARRDQGPSVALDCRGVEIRSDIYVGAASLVDIYRMLHSYAEAHHSVLDSIYDHNVRKWLGKRARSVNAGIVETLTNNPDRFVAYNNGITMVCRAFSPTATGLSVDSPQIVNGCQTTRTLYDFMENQFAGLANQLQAWDAAAPYRGAHLPFKLIAVESLDDELVKDITRFSNKQNAVRGKDFLTLEDDFRRLKDGLRKRGYYLEVQTGEYAVLPKAEQQRFPRTSLINAFDALRFYGAAVLGKPHVAFGRSGDFTPGGREFDDVMDGLTADDLLVPWLMAQHAGELGYSVGAKHFASGDDHRNQTRYFFLYILFWVASQVLQDVSTVDSTTRHDLYTRLMRLRDNYLVGQQVQAVTPFKRLLDIADQTVATYMKLAGSKKWYTDRNAFLKREEILNEERLLVASAAALLNKDEAREEANHILNAQKG